MLKFADDVNDFQDISVSSSFDQDRPRHAPDIEATGPFLQTVAAIIATALEGLVGQVML